MGRQGRGRWGRAGKHICRDAAADLAAADLAAAATLQAEERAVGQVQRSVYLAYLKVWSSAFYWVPIAVLISAVLERGLQVGEGG